MPLDGRQVLAEFEADVDALDGELATDDGQDAADGLVHVHPFHDQAGLLAEGPQVVDDVCCPVHLLADLRGHLPDLPLGDLPVLLDEQVQVLAAHLDGIEGLVDLVGDAGAHLAQGLHLGRLHELRVLLHHLGDVRHRNDDGAGAAVANGTGMHVDVERPVVLLVMQDLRVIDAAGVGLPVLQGGEALLDQFVPEVAEGQADKLLLAVLVKFHGTRVRIQNPLGVAVHDEDGVRARIEEGAVFHLRLLQAFAVQADGPDHAHEGIGQLDDLVPLTLSIKEAGGADLPGPAVGLAGLPALFVEMPARHVRILVGRTVGHGPVQPLAEVELHVEIAPAQLVGNIGQTRDGARDIAGDAVADIKDDDDDGRDEAQEHEAELGHELVDVLLAQAHVHGADAVEALVHGHRDIVGSLSAHRHQPYAVHVALEDWVGNAQGAGERHREGVRQDLPAAVQDEDVVDEVLPLAQPRLVENEIQQLRVVLVQDQAAAALGDGVGHCHAALLQFLGQAGDEDPARQQGDGRADDENDDQDGDKDLVLQGDAGVRLHGLASTDSPAQSSSKMKRPSCRRVK